MENIYTHKGQPEMKAVISYIQEDNCFCGEILGLTGTADFYFTSIDELPTAFQETLDAYLESCQACQS